MPLMSFRRSSLLVGAALSLWGLPQAQAQQADDTPGPIRGPRAVEGRSRQVTAEEAEALDEADAAREKPEAAAVPKVLLLPVPPLSGEVSARQADELTEMLSGALDGAELESVPWQAPVATGADASLAAATTALAGAETFWAQGQEAAKAARWSQAATAYAAGVALFRQHWTGATDLAPLVDGLLQLAEARRQLGEDDQVDPLLEEAIRLDGRRQPAAPAFDPALVARYTALRQARMGGARAVLEVNAAREGVEVVVDGRSVGRTPLRVSGLLPGQHLVQWRLDDQLVGAQVVQATAEGKATAMLAVGDGPLVRLGKALEGNRIDPALGKLVRPLSGRGRPVGADLASGAGQRNHLPGAGLSGSGAGSQSLSD